MFDKISKNLKLKQQKIERRVKTKERVIYIHHPNQGNTKTPKKNLYR